MTAYEVRLGSGAVATFRTLRAVSVITSKVAVSSPVAPAKCFQCVSARQLKFMTFLARRP